MWARERCRISPPRFLAECCKRQLNQGSFVLLYFRLFTFSDLYWVCLFVFSCTVLFVSISQVIGCEDRLRNDLYCVEWGVKLYSNQPCIVQPTTFCWCYLSGPVCLAECRKQMTVIHAATNRMARTVWSSVQSQHTQMSGRGVSHVRPTVWVAAQVQTPVLVTVHATRVMWLSTMLPLRSAWVQTVNAPRTSLQDTPGILTLWTVIPWVRNVFSRFRFVLTILALYKFVCMYVCIYFFAYSFKSIIGLTRQWLKHCVL